MSIRLTASLVDLLESRRLLAGHLPDVAFGDAGFANLPGSAYLSIPSDNGKVTLVERLSDSTGIRIRRLNSNGSTDTSFGNNGVGPVMSFNFVDIYKAIQQPDGKILITGGDVLFLARFNADGSIDNTFGTNGIVKPAVDIQGSQPTTPMGGLSLQSDGKIIAAGHVFVALQRQNANFAVIYRFNANGSSDTSFGDNGRVLVQKEGIYPTMLTTLGDDSLLVGATGGTIARFTADGIADTNFSADGITTIDLPREDDEFFCALPLDNGMVLLGGGTYDDGDYYGKLHLGSPIILQMKTDGTIDNTFAQDGLFTAGVQWVQNLDYEWITTMTRDASGNIFAAGTWQKGKFTLHALTANGKPNTSFAENGIISAAKEIYPNHVALLNNGNVIVSGGGANKTGMVARVSIPTPAALGANGTLYLRGTESDDTIIVQPSGTKISVAINGAETEFEAADVTSFEVDGFAGSDVITISVGLDALVRPGAGNDSVTTSIGNDTITEPNENSGRDTIRSSDGDDSISTGVGDDRVIAGSGQMNISTGIGDDYVTVGNGKMNIDLSNGNDVLTTGLCDFSDIQGGYGNDTITTFGSVSIIAGAGYRSLKWNPTLPDDDTIIATGGRVRVELDGGNNTCTIDSRFGATVGGGTGNDWITTGSGNDHIDPIDGNDTVYSNGGNDLINNLGDSDYIDAGSGDDSINSGSRGAIKPCTIYGGSGNESITARGGGKAYGGSGNDGISAARGLGAFPVDTSISLEAHGQSGNDTLTGSDGKDKLYGGEGDDWLRGGMSPDKLFGGAGNDKLSGNGGADMLLGDIGNDTLFGNTGDDKLYSNDQEADTVDGGDGNDLYDSDQLDLLTNSEQPMT